MLGTYGILFLREQAGGSAGTRGRIMAIGTFSNITYTELAYWYEGSAELLTYQLDELVGTKLRALYQRRKGRDLYDLYKALTMGNVNVDHVIHCYREYMAFVVDHPLTHKEYVLNMEEKMQDDEFLGDTKNILRSGDTFNPSQGYELVKSTLIDRLQS